MRTTGEDKEKVNVVQLSCGENEQVVIQGYKWNQLKAILIWTCIILTVGFLRLVFHWKPAWMIICTHTACNLKVADSVILTDHYKQAIVSKVRTQEIENGNSEDIPKSVLLFPKNNGFFETVSSIRFFKYKKHKYIWHEGADGQGTFQKLASLGDSISCSYFHQQRGLTNVDQIQRQQLFGNNEITVPLYSILKLLFLEVLNPFYIFQVFSVSLWYSDEYEQYASAIVVMSVVSVAISVYQLKKNQRALRDTIQQAGIVTVWRQGDEYITIPTEEVVPGDIIVPPSHGCAMMCDAVLINGNCIVNEASLTGESIPVLKTPLPNYTDTQFDEGLHARHILYSGTKVIQTRYYGDEKVKAVVIRTGYMTQKGCLVRSILYPKPVDFKFSEDAAKFIMFLALIAFGGFIYTTIIMKKRNEDAGKIAKRALDLITIVVPPALPAAMTVGIIYAQNRLRRVKIFCISPRSINISGSINCVCFDKTGTLTEEGLDVLGVLPSNQSVFSSMVAAIDKLPVSTLTTCMATCHSLTIIENRITGDPLDLKMFHATGWEMEEPEVDDANKYEIITPTVVRPNTKCNSVNNMYNELQDPEEIGIIRQFTFSSSLQRMSVITRSLTGKRFELYAKGSPEMIISLCESSSVPDNFNDTLKTYTVKGYRVIGLGHRILPKLNYSKIQRIKRADVECDLTFLGLLVMENRLKTETKDTISVLHKANIRTIMITGDNILTAMSVARECGILNKDEICMEIAATREMDGGHPPALNFSDPSSINLSDNISITKESLNLTLGSGDLKSKARLSITGKSLDIVQRFYPHMLDKLLHRGAIFARMSPDQKQFVIENLQRCGFYVGMCGDGANDCGALKAAHAGISLSEAEASIASPFTSKTDDISCVPSLIREGRAALVTSFGMFKYMAIYSMCQFTSVLLLYTFRSNLTDWEFIYIDLFLITVFAALFGRTEAYEKLSKRPPSLSLISATPIISLLIHVVLIVAFQGIAFYITTIQPWYLPHHPDPKSEDEDLSSFDNFSVFSISLFQYIGTAVIFSKGAPYRKSIFTNRLFICVVTIMTGASVFLILYPVPDLVHLFEFKVTPSISFRAMLLLIAAANFMLSFLAEFFIIDYVLSKRFRLDEKKFWKGNQTEYKEICNYDYSNSISPNDPTGSPFTILSPLSPDSPKAHYLPSRPSHLSDSSEAHLASPHFDPEPEVIVSSPLPMISVAIECDDNNPESVQHPDIKGHQLSEIELTSL